MKSSPPARFALRALTRILLLAILFLFFFQLLAEFVESVYAFGLMGTGIPPEIVSVGLLLSPALLLLPRRGLPRIVLVSLTTLVLAARVAEAFLDTRGRMLVAGLGLALFLILLAETLRTSFVSRVGAEWGAGLAFAVLLSAFLRALGSGSDLSLVRPFHWVGWILALLALVCLAVVQRTQPTQPAPEAAVQAAPGAGRTLLMALGLMGVLVLLYFAFTSPTVIARWTEGSYQAIVAVLTLAMACYVAVRLLRPAVVQRVGRGWLIVLNLLFVAALVGTIAVHQVPFPAAPGGFPLGAPPVGLVGDLLLYLALVLSPIVVIDAERFAVALLQRPSSARAGGLAWLVASLYLLVMIFLQVFTTVYDYFPVVGPLFRDRFWLVFLIAGAACALPALALPPDPKGEVQDEAKWLFGRLAAAKSLGVAVLTVLAIGFVGAAPATPAEERHSLRIMTYNIQQGYDANGQRNYAGQLQVIREMNPDVLGLEESDTARIAGGNADVVRTMADSLDMHSYYGPTTVTGTFGIALLSRYPIENPRTVFMYSLGEQTAAILADITVSGQPFRVVVTHLGNGGPIIQQEQLLAALSGQTRLVAMGDFNFRPDSDQYRLTAGVLEDSWLTRWGLGGNPTQIDPADRIDHIFVSPGTTVIDSRYITGPASDHPAMVTEIGW